MRGVSHGLFHLLGASQFPYQPKHRKDDRNNPEDVQENTGDGKGDTKDHPQDQKENGQDKKLAHRCTLVLIDGGATEKRTKSASTSRVFVKP